MKKLLLILLCLPLLFNSCKKEDEEPSNTNNNNPSSIYTYVPDDNFEQALINLDYDTGTPNGSVPTANINTITYLDVNNQNIADLTGIEDFTALTYLDCAINSLTSLDVSQNTALESLLCGDNQLTSLAISTALIELYCAENQLVILDVSQNTTLTYLECYNNQLTSLDVRNGNNTNITAFYASQNPNLYCINVDDFQYSLFNWTSIDAQHYFSNNCP